MKLKPAIFLLLIVFTTAFFSACTSVESKNSEEVVIENKTPNSRDEIIITNADIKDENLPASTTQASTELAKRLLSDKSEIVTLIDGFGNKTETRYFPGNTRIRYVSLRTSVDGVREVTVYGANGTAKIVPEIGDEAMTLPGEQLANTAQLNTSQPSPVIRNYLKRRNAETKTPLQPLPSSAFQQPPTVQYTQPQVETVQPQTSTESEKPAPQQSNPEEK